jgi:hypothetical protein
MKKKIEPYSLLVFFLYLEFFHIFSKIIFFILLESKNSYNF